MRERDRGYISNQGNGKRERGREEEKGILSNQVVLDYTFSIYWETKDSGIVLFIIHVDVGLPT